MRAAPALWTSRVAAFLAVALLSFAGVKAAVMQTQMAAATTVADCGMAGMASMPGMAGIDGRYAAPAPPKAAGPASKADPCPFCMDAANAPLIAVAAPLRPPTSTVFVVAPARPPLGARAPPAFQPRARGPPSSLQTA